MWPASDFSLAASQVVQRKPGSVGATPKAEVVPLVFLDDDTAPS